MKGWDPAQSDTPPNQCVRGKPTKEERYAWTEENANEHCWRCEASLVWPDQRTTEKPIAALALLQLNRNRRAPVRHDADLRVALRCHDPEASDKWTQRVGSFVESYLRALDESATNTHPRAVSAPSA